ncbi:hypothetical protein ACKWTF_007752 [Chironomus riparius]
MLFPLFNISVVHATENHKSNYRKTKNDKIYVGDPCALSRRATRSSINYCSVPVYNNNNNNNKNNKKNNNCNIFNCCRGGSISSRESYTRSSHSFNSGLPLSSHK